MMGHRPSMRLLRLATAFLSISWVSQVQGQECQQEINCKLPDCFCPTETHPLGRDNIPQIVYFGFDDAVQTQVASYYDSLFTGARRNHNGCPITMTLYISHQYTQYDLVSRYYQRGDEMGVHSVTHQDIDTAAKLLKEATEQKDNIEKMAKVPAKDIIGWRSPNLKTAGDDQPRILKQLNYTYDNSLSYSRDRSYQFPFTLDYGYPYPCVIQPCPDSRHEGFWELMIHSFFDPVTQLPCGYVDGCRPESKDAAVEYLWTNFLATYENQKAPFGLNMHAAWFAFPHYLEAMAEFVDRILGMEDVYIVSVEKMMAWMKTPVPLSDIKNFEPWGCTEGSGIRRPNRAVGSHRSPLPGAPPKPVAMHKNTARATDNHSSLLAVIKPPSEASKGIQLPNWYQRYAENIKTSWEVQKPSAQPATTTAWTSASHVQEPFLPQRFMTASESSHAIPSRERESCTQGGNCKLPQCFCKTSHPPSGPYSSRTQQIVYLAIDAPIDGRTFRSLTRIFYPNRFNANGCAVTGSVFIPSAGSYPPYVNALHNMGTTMGFRLRNGSLQNQDIASFVRHMNSAPSNSFGLRIDNINTAFSRDVLKAAHAINETPNKFVVRESTEASWPYTMDFVPSDKRCPLFADCSRETYPGVWEVPLSPFRIPGHGGFCWYPQSCPQTTNVIETYRILKYNFDTNYFNSRTPLGIAIKEDWLVGEYANERIEGLNLFIDHITQKPDVMVLSVDKMLEWIKSTGSHGESFTC